MHSVDSKFLLSAPKWQLSPWHPALEDVCAELSEMKCACRKTQLTKTLDWGTEDMRGALREEGLSTESKLLKVRGLHAVFPQHTHPGRQQKQGCLGP